MGAVLSLLACAPSPSLQSEKDPKVVKIDEKSSGIQIAMGALSSTNSGISSVVVSVNHMDLILSDSSKGGRLSLESDVGSVDLTQLSSGLSLPLGQTTLPKELTVHQIRLVLNDTGNFMTDSEGKVCQLKTPSAQKSGLKIVLSGGGLKLAGGTDHNLAIDFDVDKSIVMQGNGNCLLKPVIHLNCEKHNVASNQVTDCQITSDDPPVNEDPTDEYQPIDDPWEFFQ